MLQIHNPGMSVHLNRDHVYRDIILPLRYLQCHHSFHRTRVEHDLCGNYVDFCFLSVRSLYI